MYVKLLTNNFLSEKAVGKSESKDVHLAVLRVLPEVIRESVDAERHADYRKGEGGKGTEGERRDAGRIVAVNQGKRDGSGVDADASSKSVIVYDPATGEKKMVSPTAVDGIESLGEVKTAEQREAEINAHMQDTIQRSKDWLEGNVANPVGMQIQLGDGRIATIEEMHEDGKSAIATLPDGTQFLVPNDVLQRIVNNGQYADYKARRDAEASNREAEQSTESAPETATEGGQSLPEEASPKEESREYAQGDVFDVVVDGNKMHAEIVSPKDADGRFVVNVDDGESMRTLYVTPEELAAMEYREEPSPKAEETRLATEDSSDKAFERGAQPTEEHTPTALERIPRDEKGNAQFHDVDTETAWDGLVEMSGNDETAHKVAEASLANAERKLKAAKALKEKGETPEELLRSIKENEAAAAEAQRTVDAWKAIVGEKSRREEAAKAEAERIATEKAEAERKAAEERERAEAEEKTRIEAEKKEAERIAAEKAEEEARVEAERKAEEERKAKQKTEEKVDSPKIDKQGNPIDAEGRLITEKVEDISDLSDDDFNNPKRSVELPKIPKNIDNALGANGKPVIIKKNIFERNKNAHSDLTAEQSREILKTALYSADLYAKNQKSKRPFNWVIIKTKDHDGKNKLVLLEVNDNKDNVEIVHWHYLDDRGLEKIKKQAEREGGQLLILPSEKEEAGALSSRTSDLPADKGSEKAEKKQEKQSVFDKAKEIADKEEKKRKAEADKPKQKPLTEAERKDAEEVAGALGYRVEWVDTMAENGTIDADKKVIRIAKDAENPLVQVLGHEVAHGVKRMDGGKFKALQKAAMEVVGEKEWNERIEKKRKLNAYAEGKLAEEVTCDIVGEALNDKDALKRLAESLRGEKGILARLRDAVARMVEYFKNRGDKEGVRRMKAADRLLAEFESALKDGDGVNESAREADVPTDNVGNIDFSHRTYHDHKDDDGNEHRGTRGKIIEYLNNVGMKKSDIGKFVDNMDYWYDLTGKVASLVDKDGHFDFPAFHEWSQTSPLYKKYEGNIVRAVSTLVSNGEYPLNFELSTDCIKREAFTQILNEMVDLGGAIWKNLTPAKIQELRTLQQSYGIQVACPLCFVEGKRLNIMKWATGVTDKWNEAVRRVVGDEATPFGFGKGTYVPATPYNERTTPQEVTDQINEVARIVGSREGALPKDLARMQENTKAMEALLQQYYEDYVAKHGSAEGFSLSEAQLGELAKLRGKGASNVVDRMVDIIATHPELQHTLDVSDLVGSKGLMAIRGQSGDGFAKMYSLIVCANGTGTPKIVQDAQPYSGEILDVRQSKFDKAAEIGGARLFSFSDFDLTKTFDIMQIMWDCAARKAKVQSYSKEIPYILMFGKSGVKINMSMLPEARPSEGLVQEYKEAKGSARKYVLEKIRENAGLDMEGGHIVGIQLSDSHSVSKEFAESIYHNPDYNANCGAIMVGISVNHALYAMGQDYIRQVIPFHLSGMPISARRATDCQYYRDFTSEQNTGIIVNGRRVKQFDGGGKPIHNKDVPSDFDFYEGENEKGWDMRQRCRDYVKWCGENGLVPRFEWAVNSDNYKAWCKKKGYQPNQEIVDMMDAHTTDGVYDEYYKVITDFTAYKPIFDKDGNTIGEEPAPHRPVTGDFSMDDKTLGMVLGVDSEGRKVDDNSMLANRENTIKNADANKKEIAEKALLILNGKAKVEDLVRKGGEQFDNNSDSDKFFESSNEGIDRSVRESRSENTELTAEERELRDNLVERMRKGGLDVVTDSEEMQRVIDTENERTRNKRSKKSEAARKRDEALYAVDWSTAFVSGKSREETTEIRRERGRKFKEETKELYGRVLSGNFDDVTLRLIDKFVDNSTPNNPYERPISKRLPARALQKMRGGERTGSIDALFSRISESAVGKDGKALPRAERERAIEEKKKELLKKWAIATGNWHTDIADFTDQREPIGSGTDSDVYLGKDGKSVIKVSKGKPYGKRFRPDVDNVALFNTVFPGSRYTIEGYGEIDGKFVRFLKQPIVDFTSSTPLTEGERVAYMEKLGFKPINKENTAFSNGEIIASDLQKSNIVKDKQGNVRVIDADMKLHTKDFGGKFSYPDAETDTRTDGVQRFLRTADGEVYGLVKDGRIYLDPKVATSETAVHEYTHLWGDMLRRKDSEQWSRTVKELKNSVLWEEVKESYPELKTDDEIADEVLSTFSGRRGAERLREEARRVADGDGGVFTKAKAIETLERVKEAIARFWEGVARMFGINRYRSAEELADMAMRDLLDSKNPMKDESGMRKRGEVGDEGVKSLKGEEAMVALDNIFEDKKTENMPQKVSSLVKFMELFRKPVRTFLGEVVNVKEEVYNKIIREKRTSISGAVLPTLENADFAIRDTDGSTLYIKRFKSENNDNVYNIAVVNKYGEVEDYVSSVHIKSDNNLRNKITKGAELLLPQERITDGILPRNNPTPTANVTNISEPSKPRFSRKPGESIFDYASRVSEDVDRSVRERVSARDEYEKKVKSKGFQTKEALQNSMLGLQEFMSAIDHASGNKRYIEDIPDFENPILGENRLSSVNKEEMHQVAKTQFKPLMSAVAKLSGNGKESGELYDYMFAKHGLERDAVMRQREAQREFDKYQKANPKGTKTIGDFVASLEGKDYAGLTALTAEDGRVKSIQSQIDAIDEQMKATDDQLLLRKLGGQKKRLKVDLLNAARDAADDIRKTFENNPSHDRSDINELWSRVNEVNGNTLRKLYESGMLTKEAYNDISSMYTNYIPMRGFDQTTSADAYAYLTHGDSAFNAPIKTAKGRSSKADNPIAYMQAMAESAIMQGNRNVLVKQKMLNFVRNHPSDLASISDVWLQYDSVADEWKPVFPDNIGANDSASVVAKKMEAFEDKMKQMADKHPDLVQRSNEAPDIPYKVVEKGQLNEHQVLVKQNGKSYIITVNGSPRAAQAANGLTNPDTDLTGAVGKVFEGAEALNRQLSSLYTTLNPDFIGSNYVRDALYSNTMVYVKEGAKYGGSFNLNFAKYNPAEMANLYARYNKGSLDTSNETHRLFLEFMQNGGETGFVNLKQIEKRKSEIAKAIKRDGEISAAQIWGGLNDAIDFANRAVEDSARFAAYVTSRKSGRSVGRSVYDAKEISVNFNRKGSGRNWWKDNVGTSRFYDTEIGLVEINRASVGSSLAHRYSQVKLDVITSLAEGFNNAVYFGSMQDFSRQEGVKSHYFAYPINYNGNRNYVFCRAMQDANKSRLYVHEVFLADNIEKGNTLQTAASQPHGGITLYKDILANVLAANVTNDSETSKPCFSRKPGESIFDYASRVSEDVDRSVCEGR